MSGIATRYAPALVVLSLLVLAPVLLHSYGDFRDDDCAGADRLVPPALHDAAWEKRDEWMRRHFDAFAWTEGRLPAEAGSPPLRWSIIRSYDPKRLYNRPERQFAGGEIPVSRKLVEAEVEGGVLPVYLPRFQANAASASVPFTAYVLIYDGAVVENPYRAQLEAAPALAFQGSRPMTLLMASGRPTLRELGRTRERAIEWLSQARERYFEVCETS